MVLGEGPNWSRRVPSKKFKICDPPFYECPQIPNFHSREEHRVVHHVQVKHYEGQLVTDLVGKPESYPLHNSKSEFLAWTLYAKGLVLNIGNLEILKLN